MTSGYVAIRFATGISHFLLQAVFR